MMAAPLPLRYRETQENKEPTLNVTKRQSARHVACRSIWMQRLHHALIHESGEWQLESREIVPTHHYLS